MPRRTYEHQTDGIDRADDIDELVHDKRAGWRANAAKGRRRQRRYQNRMTAALRHVANNSSADHHGYDVDSNE